MLNRVYTGRAQVGEDSRLPFEAARQLHIVIDTTALRLTLELAGKPIASYAVAVGKSTTPTPIGYWHIKEKAVWAGGFGIRWMGLNVPWGVYGIHGTNKPWTIGSRASGGCIRMTNQEVVKLFDLVQVGTPVTIKGRPFYRYGEVRRTIRPTHIGSDVAQLQRKLAALGHYQGHVDGKYGRLTRNAVREYQAAEELPVTGIVGPATYDRLGIVPLEDDPELRPEQQKAE
jgi:murein L,D-transpeptidase YcbB/YkuD